MIYHQITRSLFFLSSFSSPFNAIKWIGYPNPLLILSNISGLRIFRLQAFKLQGLQRTFALTWPPSFRGIPPSPSSSVFLQFNIQHRQVDWLSQSTSHPFQHPWTSDLQASSFELQGLRRTFTLTWPPPFAVFHPHHQAQQRRTLGTFNTHLTTPGFSILGAIRCISTFLMHEMTADLYSAPHSSTSRIFLCRKIHVIHSMSLSLLFPVFRLLIQAFQECPNLI